MAGCQFLITPPSASTHTQKHTRTQFPCVSPVCVLSGNLKHRHKRKAIRPMLCIGKPLFEMCCFHMGIARKGLPGWFRTLFYTYTATWNFRIKTQNIDGFNSLLVYWQAGGLEQWVIQRYGAGSPSHTDHCIPARLPKEKQKYKYTLNTNTQQIQDKHELVLDPVLKVRCQISHCVSLKQLKCCQLTSGFSEFLAMLYCSTSQ